MANLPSSSQAYAPSRLPRLRVTEKYGMRRFLYPLQVSVELPASVAIELLALQTASGTRVPAYFGDDPTSDRLARVEFAVSLAPLETLELELVEDSPISVPDPMKHRRSGGGGIETTQERYRQVIDDNALLGRVVYDCVEHLRAPLEIRLNGQRYSENNNRLLFSRASEITASVASTSIYPSGVPAATLALTTACKSWITLQHRPRVKTGDKIAFFLPFNVLSPTLLCDFGLGGGIYTKFTRESTDEVSVHIDENLNWSLKNGDRVDYAGILEREHDPDRPLFHGLAPLWFHVVDEAKAIAVAITEAPADTADIDIHIRTNGDIVVEFTAGGDHDEGAAYAVCYHFLNDVPAIAAATCPQSIMLPPTVEVVE